MSVLGESKKKTFPKCHCQMLVLALERATDGHDSLDCQMALKHPNTNLKQVTAFRKYHLTKEITIMRKTSHRRAFYLQSLSLFSSVQ